MHPLERGVHNSGVGIRGFHCTYVYQSALPQNTHGTYTNTDTLHCSPLGMHTDKVLTVYSTAR